jgi:uncharacterized protein YutE (UPF0331/DUF86 family)
MTDKATLENQISRVEKYLSIVRRYEKYPQEEIKNNIDLRGAVERYLYLLTQATIDLAESVVAYKDLRKPASLSETFHILQEADFITTELMNKLVAMTGFRNVIAHDYGEIDYSIVYDVIHKGVKDIDKFLKIIKRKAI